MAPTFMEMSQDAVAKRHRLVTALVALVDHIGGLGTKHSLEADRLAMELVDAVELTHEEWLAAQTEIESRRLNVAHNCLSRNDYTQSAEAPEATALH